MVIQGSREGSFPSQAADQSKVNSHNPENVRTLGHRVAEDGTLSAVDSPAEASG